MDPGTMLLLSAGSAIMQGMAGASQARAEQKREEINAYIGKTRAMQTQTAGRDSLEQEVSSMRSVLGANGQGGDSAAFDLIQRVRDIRRGETRTRFGAEMAGVADHQMAAANAGQRATGAMLAGFGNALPSLFDFAAL